MKTQHSPGPWEIEHIYTEDQIMGSMTILCDNGRPIAKTNHSLISKNLPPEEILANARLIAAAPELLKDHETDLILIEGWLNDYQAGKSLHVLAYALENLLVSKRAIIAKATQSQTPSQSNTPKT